MPSPVAVPVDPISARSSKAKAIGTLSKYEQADQSVHISICIKKKIVNGQVVVSGTINRDFGPGNLPEEYTDMPKFKKLVSETVNDLADQLGSDKAGS